MMNRTAISRQRELGNFEQLLVSLFLGLILFLAVIVVFFLGYQLWFAGRIFPGVSVGNINVGGMAPQEAATLINEQLSYPLSGHIVLQDGEHTWLATPAELGLYLNPEQSTENAFAVGRRGGLSQRLNDQVTSWTDTRALPPVMALDERITYQYLVNLSQSINVPIIEANLGLQGTEVTVRSGQIGRTLDIDASLKLISTQLQTLQDGIVPLVINETPPIILDASQQAEQARTILAAPLTLTMPDGEQGGPWVIDPPTLAAMLNIERLDQGTSGNYQITLNSDLLRNYLLNIAPDLEQSPKNSRFIFNDESHQLEIKEPAVIGRSLDIGATIAFIQEKIVAGEHTIALQFDIQKPAVTDDMSGADLGITELIHSETSYFYGSDSDRVKNISVAASSFHGLLVAPGETFSMATALGDISLDNGYAEALIILGGQTIKGVGGGVCQVSTTLFRAAFFTGFPIVERYSHAYRVSYYEKVAGNRVDTSLAGLDATVFVPLVDLKFVNDTPYWLLMETYVNPSTSAIQWKFYSTSDGRQVNWETSGPVNEVDPPEPLYKENPDLEKGEIKQIDWAAKGADVTVKRTVTKNGQVYFEDVFRTHYQAWRAVYEYGPGTENIPTPKPEE